MKGLKMHLGGPEMPPGSHEEATETPRAGEWSHLSAISSELGTVSSLRVPSMNWQQAAFTIGSCGGTGNAVRSWGEAANFWSRSLHGPH